MGVLKIWGPTMSSVTTRRWVLIGIGVVILAVGSVIWIGGENPVGPWFDRAGNPVPDERLSVWTGSDHCGTANTKFMALAWPLDVPVAYMGESRTKVYVWQPPDDYLRPGAVTPRIVAAMPSGARNTGLHRGRLTLWVSESNLRQAVFVRDGDEIQRWAFAPGGGYCA
jgi:hypothetical protein